MNCSSSLPTTTRPLLPVTVLALATIIVGCKPNYPACETDKDCHQKEFCVGGKCQQCREASD